MQEHTKMIAGGSSAFTLATFAHILHEGSAIASDVAAYLGLLIAVVGIMKLWKHRKDK